MFNNVIPITNNPCIIKMNLEMAGLSDAMKIWACKF